MKRHWSSSEKAFYTHDANKGGSQWVNDHTECTKEWVECFSETTKASYFQSILTGARRWTVPSSSELKSMREEWLHRLELCEDHPLIALERDKYNQICLDKLVELNSAYGPMKGNSKTSRACLKDGMRIGLQGLYSRIIWTQLLEQLRHFGELGTSSVLRDPLFPKQVFADPDVEAELIEAGRKKEEAAHIASSMALTLTSTSIHLLAFAASIRADHSRDDSAISLAYSDGRPVVLKANLESDFNPSNMLRISFSSKLYLIRGDHFNKLLTLYRLHTSPSCAPLDPTFV